MDNKLPRLLFWSYNVTEVFGIPFTSYGNVFVEFILAKHCAKNCIVLAITYSAVIYYLAFKASRELV